MIVANTLLAQSYKHHEMSDLFLNDVMDDGK
jgi:hypothetical protein